MTPENLNEIFDKVVAEALHPEVREQITEDLDLLTVGVESLGLIKLIMRLEDELGIFWPVEQLAEHDKFTVVGVLRKACHEYAGLEAPVGGSEI